ncbi:MAG: TetR family transcriptional regulator [Candidatus Kapabacteria bacterium]|nr:TetR family transcriptional regulator [Candidatus Kapabacteria bacterium]
MSIPKKEITSDKIKDSAKKLFTTKGYSATTIRDIAKESQVNIALINYYYRSKENLFRIIMEESFEQLFKQIIPILNNKDTTLEEKIESLVNNYLEFLLEFPELPLFVLNELKNNPKHLETKINLKKKVSKSSLINQIMAKNSEINPLHFVFNLLGMIVFPFIMKPVISSSKLLENEIFNQIINERKHLIPLWMNSIFNSKTEIDIFNQITKTK